MNEQLVKISRFLSGLVKKRTKEGVNDPLTFPYICDHCGSSKFEILRATRSERTDQKPGYDTIAILYCDNCGEAIVLNVLSLMFRLDFEKMKETNGETIEYSPDERHIHDNCICACGNDCSPDEQRCISDNWI